MQSSLKFLFSWQKSLKKVQRCNFPLSFSVLQTGCERLWNKDGPICIWLLLIQTAKLSEPQGKNKAFWISKSIFLMTVLWNILQHIKNKKLIQFRKKYPQRNKITLILKVHLSQFTAQVRLEGNSAECLDQTPCSKQSGWILILLVWPI